MTTETNIFEAPNAVFVVGPTASGKSEFAFRFAKRHNGEVISADSMQIYRGLDIGTAKESVERRSEVRHHMIDILDAGDSYSVAEFAEAASMCAKDILSRGKIPVIAGGTGLYFESLFYPMSFANTAKNPVLRAELEAECNQKGAEFMHARLASVDPESAARLHVNDVKRVIRALEVVLTTGKTVGEHSDGEKSEPDVIAVGFNRADRHRLYAAIDRRVEEMISAGLVDEVGRVGRFDCQSMLAIGYKEFSDCVFSMRNGKFTVDGESLRDVAEKIKKDTRNYAKRQITWFKRYPFVRWFESGDYTSAEEYVLSRMRQY